MTGTSLMLMRLRAALAVTLCLTAPSMAAPPVDVTKTLMAKNLVDIGGRRLNLTCTGQGSPTVVFELGLGSNLLHWQRVAGDVSAFARACFYDRAGHGFSDPSGSVGDAMSVTNDLHELLQRAGVKPPLVLVGHSLGGLFQTLYADRFLNDVGGIVLIDPSFADQDKDISPSERASDEKGFHEFTDNFRACAALARSGKNPTEGHPECFTPAANRTAEEIAFLKTMFARADEYDAMISEAEAFHPHNGERDVDSVQENAASRSFGAIPLIVLSRSIHAKYPGQSDEEHAQGITRWTEGHKRLAARSSRGEMIVVPDSVHYIQIEQPTAVVDAIRKVVEQARAKP